MKKNIHPKYNHNITAKCACGHKFTTGSTKSELQVEICSACHPFFTGKQKLVDTARRVEKFQAKAQKSNVLKSKTSRTKKQKNEQRRAKKIAKKVEKPTALKPSKNTKTTSKPSKTNKSKLNNKNNNNNSKAKKN